MWKHIFVAFSLAVLTVSITTASDVTQSNLLARWFFHVISRGFYLLLISLIFICFIVSAVKNRVCAASQNKDISHNDETLYETEIEEDDFNGKGEGTQENLVALKEKLRQAEELICALQREVGETQNRTSSNVGITIDEIDRSRTVSKEEMINTQLDIVLEIENMRHENALMQRQLEDAKTDNENLTRKIEAMQREARISEAALRDQQSLSERLRGARSELDELKSHLQGIKVERDTAVRIAAEHIYKMTPDMTPQKIDVIEAMIDAELRRVREEEEAAEEASCKTDYELTFTESHDTIQPTAETVRPSQKVATDSHRNPLGDAPSIYTTQDDDPSNLSDYDSGTRTNSYEYSGESRKSRIVTRSPAFRAFLQNAFHPSD